MENKKLNNIISVVLTLLIVGIAGFFIYKNFIQIGSNRNINIFSNKEEDKSLNDNDVIKKGLEKYNMLYSMNNINDNTFIFFKDEDVNANNISNQDKLHILYSLLSDDDKNKTGTYSENCFISKGIYTKDTYPDTCPKETFDKSLLEEKLRTNFDNSMSVTHEDFFATPSLQCFITDSVYTCYLNSTNYTIPEYTTFMKYDVSNQEDNKLLVYNYLLTVRRTPYDNYDKGIYSNASATNKIDDLPFEIGDTKTQELTDKLITKYVSKITRYKSTFVKNSNNNYVWQSTEVEK